MTDKQKQNVIEALDDIINTLKIYDDLNGILRREELSDATLEHIEDDAVDYAESLFQQLHDLKNDLRSEWFKKE